MTVTDRTVQLVNDYNSTEQQLAPLQNSENEMQNVDSQVATVSGELGRRQSLLNKTQQDDAHLQKRIHRNENPRFLHYLVCNREAKVERLKGERGALVALHQDLSSKIATDSQQLSSLRQQQQSIHSVVDRKHQLESHCRSLFDQIVNEQPPTPNLQQLQANVQQQHSLVAAEQGLASALAQSSQIVQQGLALFKSAEGHYRQAAQLNHRAQQVNRSEAREARRERIDEAFGNDWDANNAEWNREHLEREERRLQAERDSLINQSNNVAMQAYQLISSAFSSFPMEARTRYPDLCQAIGHVALPRLQGADFSSALIADAIFGTMGAAMNDFTSGCKIQHNIGVMEQCSSITSHQLGLVNAIQRTVNANLQQFQSNVHNIEQNIATERTNVFNTVRASVTPVVAAAA